MFGLLAFTAGVSVGQSLIAVCVGLTTVLGCAKLGLETYRDYRNHLVEQREKEMGG